MVLGIFSIGKLYFFTTFGRNTTPEHAVSTSNVSDLSLFERLMLIDGNFPGEGRKNTSLSFLA
jgi:hypothetical protein